VEGVREGALEHPHPGAGKYLAVAGVLAALTAVEVWVYYVPGLKRFLAPVLLALSALKFSLVALFYMHLKFDNRLFTALFVVPLAIAACVLLALMGLQGAYAHFVGH
jgi:cytochrome c oxidase subunit 4